MSRTPDDDQPLTIRERILVGVGALVGVVVVRILGATWRIARTGVDYHAARRAGTGPRVVYGLWHNSLLPLAYSYRCQGACTVISQHRDGELIARIVHYLGYRTARGSSTRGGARALKAVARYVRDGTEDIAFTPDGPRGPLYEVKPGIVLAASLARMPIVPLGIAVDRCWRLSSWDRFVVPKPFARIRIVVGQEIPIQRHLDDAGLEHCRCRVQAALDEVRRQAETMLAGAGR